jgi:hypothetical protein
MKTHFKLGQVVRFKNYKRNSQEKEAYFVVIQEEDATNEMVLFTLNSNRIYISGTTIITEFPEEDLRLVSLKPSDLIWSSMAAVTDTPCTLIHFSIIDASSFLPTR